MRLDRLSDEAIRAALTPPADVKAPIGLALEVRTEVASTRQGRAWATWPGGILSGTRGLVVAALVIVVAIASLSVVLRPTISTYRGGPDRSGVMPGPGPVGSPYLEWRADAGPLGPWSPVVADGVVHVAGGDGIVRGYALDTGAVVYQRDLEVPVAGGIAIAGDRLLVPDVDGTLHVLRSADGVTLDRMELGGALRAPPAVVGELAYVGSTDGRVHAVDLAADGSPWRDAVVAPGRITRAVSVADGVVIVPVDGEPDGRPGMLVALDAGSGHPRWSVDLGPGSVGTPAASDGRVLVTDGLDLQGSVRSRVHAYDLRSGRLLWERAIEGDDGVVLIAAVADGVAHLVTSGGHVVALDMADGAERWRREVPAGESPSGALAGEVLYVTGSGDAVRAFDRVDGRELWALPIDGQARAPVVVDGRVILGTADAGVRSVAGRQPISPSAPARPAKGGVG